MEDKIPGFQFEPVSSEQICPSYIDGSDHDKAEIQHDRLSSQEWCNCKNCGKMPTILECVFCRKILEVKAFHLELQTKLSAGYIKLLWNFLQNLQITVSEIISWKSFY